MPPVYRRPPTVIDDPHRAGPSTLPTRIDSRQPEGMTAASVRLDWIPLGAGGVSVRWNGVVFEALAARLAGRAPRDLYHAALEITLGEDRWVLEMAPAWAGHGDRGVTVTGPVGLRPLGRSRAFRYEVRLWRDGVIPDLAEAVGPPAYLLTNGVRVHRLLDAAEHVPALTWGRDELGLGEMWTSNSVVSWLLATSHHDVAAVAPPPGGRAPGWDAGRQLGCRSAASSSTPSTRRVPGRAHAAFASTAWTGTSVGSTPDPTSASASERAPGRS